MRSQNVQTEKFMRHLPRRGIILSMVKLRCSFQWDKQFMWMLHLINKTPAQEQALHLCAHILHFTMHKLQKIALLGQRGRCLGLLLIIRYPPSQLTAPVGDIREEEGRRDVKNLV
jgi:hypothetical protein